MFDSCTFSDFVHHLRKYRIIYRWGSLRRPHESLKTISSIHDGIIHFNVLFPFDCDIAVPALAHVHKNKGCEFETVNDHLKTWTSVAAASPRLLFVGDIAEQPEFG